ncbi:MAG TPA: hypothetical protein VHU23_09645 [Rhizomicrobium sp.]|nr:hypothetical protein [Rhizomicrobium sp.]
MMLRMSGMAVCRMRVVRGGLMASFVVMPGGLAMMAGGMFMMLGRAMMMFAGRM